MKEIEVKVTYRKKGEADNIKVQAFQVEAGDSFSIDDEQGITKDEFFEVLDRASQPIEKPLSDSKQS